MKLTSQMKLFTKELKRRNKLLYYAGISFFALFAAFLIGFGLCEYSIVAICNWLKPAKFTFSFAVYLFSLGWFLDYLKEDVGHKGVRFLSRILVALVSIEMSLILLQSWITTDYFSSLELNTPFISRTLYLIGNTTISINVLFAGYIGWQFFKPLKITPKLYLLGIRLGFITFVVSSLIGLFLIGFYGQMAPSPFHFGLPFTRFSTARDNLITLHFIGIHLLQAIPLICYYLDKKITRTFLLITTGSYVFLSIFSVISAIFLNS